MTDHGEPTLTPEEPKKTTGRTWPDLIAELTTGVPIWVISGAALGFVGIVAYSAFAMDECRTLAFLGETGACGGGSVSETQVKQLLDPLAQEVAIKADRTAFTDSIGRVDEDLNGLRSELQMLTDPASLGFIGGDQIPEGLVAAFNGSSGCPFGWSEFEEAAGRFIIGVDRNKYRLRYEGGEPDYQTGGTETHTLTAEEILGNGAFPKKYLIGPVPSQRKALDGTIVLHAHDGGAPVKTVSTTFATYEVGEAKLDNMPPYIALYFCKKEGR